MTALPPPLAPWSRELSRFDREVALDLGAIVRRVASLVGSPNPMRRGEGDVDGFDGIAQRGPYDRLLHSEWLLADELPDEFSRRAAMNEHTFFELARQHPVQHPLTVALFDSGPSQLGPPRLVHLAALIVLARRAAAAEARFRWGVLQRPESPMLEDVREPEIEMLLASRTTRETAENDLDLWQKNLLDQSIGELWLVGPSRLAQFPFVRKQWLLEVEDVLRVDRRQVSVSLRHDTRREPPAILDLPSQKNSAQLLTRPFPEPAAAPQRPVPVTGVDLASNLLFVNRDMAIAARDAKGNLVFIPLYKQKVLRLQAKRGEIAVAAGWWKGHGPTGVFLGPEDMQIRCSWRAPALKPVKRASGPVPASVVAPLKPLLDVFNQVGQSNGFFFLDGADHLWFCDASMSLRRIVDSVVAFRYVSRHGCSYIRRGADWDIGRTRGYTTDGRMYAQGPAGERAFFGHSLNDDTYTPVGLETADGRWSLLPGNTTISVPPNIIPIGVTRSGMKGHRPGLVYISEDQRVVMVTNASETREITRTGAPIVSATTCQAAPVAALLTGDGHLVVVSLRSGKVVHDIPVEELR